MTSSDMLTDNPEIGFIAAPPLLETRLLEVQCEKKIHKVHDLDGNQNLFKKLFEFVVVILYIAQLTIVACMIGHFRGIGADGKNFWMSSLAVVCWQHFTNIVIFYAVFGVREMWSYSTTTTRRSIWRFYFYEGWCNSADTPNRCRTLFLGLLLGPLCPIVYYIEWSNWAEKGSWRITRGIGLCVSQCGLLGWKRKKWELSDLHFRQSASQSQLFRNFVNPSLFMVILNQPFAVFQLFIQMSAVIHVRPTELNYLLILAIFVSCTNALLPAIFISPTAFWDGAFLSFFAISFDGLVCLIHGLVNPFHHAGFGRAYVYASLIAVFWMPFFFMNSARNFFTKAAHIGPRFPTLQSYFTKVMSVVVLSLYSALSMYRTFSWVVEYEFYVNETHFVPSGLFAKVFGWCNLPLGQKSATVRNISKVDDYSLRVLIANVVLIGSIEDRLDGPNELSLALEQDGKKCLQKFSVGEKIATYDALHIDTWMRRKFPHVKNVIRSKWNPFAVVTRWLEAEWPSFCRCWSGASGSSVLQYTQPTYTSLSVMSIIGQIVTMLLVAMYMLTRLWMMGYLGYLYVKFFGHHPTTNRDVVTTVFLQCLMVLLIFVMYFVYRSRGVIRTSVLVLGYHDVVHISRERVPAVIPRMIKMYDQTVYDNAVSVLLLEFYGEDVGREMRQFLPMKFRK